MTDCTFQFLFFKGLGKSLYYEEIKKEYPNCHNFIVLMSFIRRCTTTSKSIKGRRFLFATAFATAFILEKYPIFTLQCSKSKIRGSSVKNRSFSLLKSVFEVLFTLLQFNVSPYSNLFYCNF